MILVDQAYHDGRRTLDRIEEVFAAAYETEPASFAYPLAVVRVHQGDWEMLFFNGNGPRNARHKYRQAYELLGQAEGGAGHMERLFGESRLLPASVVFSHRHNPRPPSAAQAPQDLVIEVTFEVSRDGRADNFEIATVAPGREDEANSLVRQLSFQRFRPALVDGQPVATRISRQFLAHDSGGFIALDPGQDPLDTAALAASKQKLELAAGGGLP